MARHVEHVTGRAIDSEGTKYPHQTASIHYDEYNKLYKLNFNVYSPEKSYDAEEIVARYFYHTENDKHEKTLSLRPDLYGDFISAIRPNENEAFELNKPHEALTYRISFAPGQGFQDFSYCPTIATMTASYTIQQAEEKLKSGQDEEFTIWNQFCLEYNKVDAERLKTRKKNDFVRILTTTTDIVRTQAKNAAFKDNIDCIFGLRDPKGEFDIYNYKQRDDYDEIKKLKAEYFFYGSVLKQKQRGVDNADLNEAFVSGTASRKGMDAFNIQVMRFFALNEVNIFQEGVAGAVAQHKLDLFQKRVTRMLGWAA